jgi:hypothetical protein
VKVDYRALLGGSGTRVLPYLGGGRVRSGDRTYRVKQELEPAWYGFELRGRDAVAQDVHDADHDVLDALPAVRGHLSSRGLALGDGRSTPIALMDETPEVLSPVLCRSLDAYVLFQRTEFDDDAEEHARAALEDQVGLAQVKGVGASLRAAFVHTLLDQVGDALQIGWRWDEVRPHVLQISEGGHDAAHGLLSGYRARREQALREQEAALARAHRAQLRAARQALLAQREEQRLARRHGTLRPGGPQHSHIERVLAGSDAELLSVRPVQDLLHVRFRFAESRFDCLVDPTSLQVIDAGICLDGADRMLTLDSLPSVLREALDTGQLVVTWRGR